MSSVPASSAVEASLPAASTSTSNNAAANADIHEAKMDESTDAHMALEGGALQPDPRSAPSAGEAVTVAAAASDGMAMDAEDFHRPDAGAVPDARGVTAEAASFIEAKEDASDQPVRENNPADAAGALAASAAKDSSDVVPAQDAGDEMIDIGAEPGNKPGDAAAAPNEQGADAVPAAANRNGQHVASPSISLEPVEHPAAVPQHRVAAERKAGESGLDVAEGDDVEDEDEEEESKSQGGGGAAAERGGEHIMSLSNDPELVVGNKHRDVIPQRRVAPKRKARESGLDDEEGDDSEADEEKGERQDEAEESKSEAGDDVAEDEHVEHEWTRFLEVNKKSVRVLWANGDTTDEPRAEFECQSDPRLFAHHNSIANMPPKKQRETLARIARSRSKATASEHKPRANRSGCLHGSITPPAKKSKKAHQTLSKRAQRTTPTIVMPQRYPSTSPIPCAATAAVSTFRASAALPSHPARSVSARTAGPWLRPRPRRRRSTSFRGIRRASR
jgi:hypothetical protein